MSPSPAPARPAADPFLAGVRVLDLTHAMAGPLCTAILSDLGAEVIKVERTDGDANRRRRASDTGVALPFEMVNRDKRCLAVDFRRAEGADAVRRLAASCDVAVENFTPGVLAKYGLDAASLRAVHPHLVYCSISGFGQTGPLRDAKATDLIVQGFSGLMSVTGQPGGEPAKAGYPVGDIGSAMYAVIGILAALARRQRTGHGAHVDVSLADTVAAWSMWEVAEYQMTGEIPGPLGTAHRLVAPYQAFVCGDGRWITVAAGERLWDTFCDVVGVGALRDDPRFADEYTRFRNREPLAAALGDAFGRAGRDEWICRLRAAGIPCGPVHDTAEMLRDDQLAERGVFSDVDYGDATLTLVNTPIRSDGVAGIRGRAPALGSDTRLLLRECGYSDIEIDRLTTDGIVLSDEPPHPPQKENIT